MNYNILVTSLFRSTAICLMALAMASVIVRYIQSCGKIYSFFYQILLLTCFFMPTIAIGYGYSYFIFLFIQNPWICNFIYFLIMVCRLIPTGIIVLLFVQPTVSSSGLHCFFLTNKRDCKFRQSLRYFWFMLRGSWQPQIAAMSLIFLLAFAEFELASLLNIISWPVYVFDSHAHGVPVLDSLKLCLLPGIAEALAIWVFLLISNRGYLKKPLIFEKRKSFSIFGKTSALLLIAMSVTVTVLFPLIMILRYAIPGMILLFKDLWMASEIINSGIFALIGTVLAGLIAWQLLELYQNRNQWAKNIVLILLIPGLMGSLPLGLFLLGIFQFPGLYNFYNTPVPLSMALAFFLFPYTFIILIVLKKLIPGEAVHTAILMVRGQATFSRGRELIWHLLTRGRFWLFFLILCRGFFDLTLAGILAPTSMPTVSTRLYNLMHYGESEKLSATVLLTILLPLVLMFFLRFFIKRISASALAIK